MKITLDLLIRAIIHFLSVLSSPNPLGHSPLGPSRRNPPHRFQTRAFFVVDYGDLCCQTLGMNIVEALRISTSVRRTGSVLLGSDEWRRAEQFTGSRCIGFTLTLEDLLADDWEPKREVEGTNNEN